MMYQQGGQRVKQYLAFEALCSAQASSCLMGVSSCVLHHTHPRDGSCYSTALPAMTAPHCCAQPGPLISSSAVSQLHLPPMALAQ